MTFSDATALAPYFSTATFPFLRKMGRKHVCGLLHIWEDERYSHKHMIYINKFWISSIHGMRQDRQHEPEGTPTKGKQRRKRSPRPHLMLRHHIWKKIHCQKNFTRQAITLWYVLRGSGRPMLNSFKGRHDRGQSGRKDLACFRDRLSGGSNALFRTRRSGTGCRCIRGCAPWLRRQI